MSGVLVVIVIIPIYVIIFNVLSPKYWNEYWLLYETKFGGMILSNIPITELFWYFSWGSFAGVGYDFVSGKRKIKKYG